MSFWWLTSQTTLALVTAPQTVNQAYGIDGSEIKLQKVLGGGSFGTVHRATVREKTVAAKVFHHQEMAPEAYDDFLNEVEILRLVVRMDKDSHSRELVANSGLRLP